MDQHVELEKDPREKDFTYSWVNSSVFLFYLQILCFLALTAGCSYSLYTKVYKGKPEVNIQSSTLYTPQYK
jgi:hypothetical protein